MARSILSLGMYFLILAVVVTEGQTPPPDSPPDNIASPPALAPSTYQPNSANCGNKRYPNCYRIQQTCPNQCPDECYVECVSCKPVCSCYYPGAVCYDPRFTGGDGITFYFHGKKDKNFCLVSDSNLHINARFIGRRNGKMKRDFTWVQALGIMFNTHKLYIGAKKTATWDDLNDRISLAFDGEPISVSESEGAKWQSATLPLATITRIKDTNSVIIEVEGNFKITATVVPITEKESRIHNYGITDEDSFAHLHLGFKFYTLSGEVNGVLGQTYGSNYVSRAKIGALMPVLGGDKEFASSSLFSTDCFVARFDGRFPTNRNSSQFIDYGLNCGSGIEGRGVVCKR